MPTWYRTGTVSVTNGSTAVAGSGTAWIASVNVGDAIHLPDGRVYEIAGVTSNTALTLATAYLGSTAGGQSYKIQPTRGVTVEFNNNVLALLAAQQGYVDGPLSGRFGAGSVSAPAVSTASDTDTGIYFPAANQVAFATGGTRRTLLSSTAFQVDVPITGTAVQSAEHDTTPGKLMVVGAFGLGETAGTPAVSDLLAQDLPVGFFQWSSTAAGVPLSGEGGYGMRMKRFGGANAQELEYLSDDNTERLFLRWRYGGTTKSPKQVYHQGSLLGTVSQAAGIPTGAIIERGSNANGEYTKFADGTMICTVSGLNTSASTDTTWTFPATFSYPANPGRPVVSGATATTVATGAYLAVGGIASGTGVNVNALTAPGTRVAVVVNLMAIGRWF